MKKVFAFVMSVALLLSLSADSFAASPLVRLEDGCIVFQDDGTGIPVHDETMDKTILATNRGIGQTVEWDGATATINSLQVSNMIAKSKSTAAYLGVVQNVPYLMISIDITVENTGNADLYLDDAVAYVVTNEKEQVQSLAKFSEDLRGLLVSGAKKEGQLLFLCKESSVLNFESFRFLYDAPALEGGQIIGDRASIEFRYEESSMTADQKAAVLDAWEYLDVGPVSRSAVLDYLNYLGWSSDVASFAVDVCSVDFAENALLALTDWIETIRSYNETEEETAKYLSYEYLFKMLTESDGFTDEEAHAALAQCGY